MIVTFACLLLPSAIVIALLTDNGKLNLTTNVSSSSMMLSVIMGTLTLLFITLLSNVAVSEAVLKSTPPVSQTLFTQHIIIHITLLPSADAGDCSDGVTVTLNGKLDIPSNSSNFINTNPLASESVYAFRVNLTLAAVII